MESAIAALLLGLFLLIVLVLAIDLVVELPGRRRLAQENPSAPPAPWPAVWARFLAPLLIVAGFVFYFVTGRTPFYLFGPTGGHLSLGFAALLLILTVLFGLTWAIDRIFYRRRRRRRVQQHGNAVKEPWQVDWARSLFPVVLVVLLLRSFVAEPFRIPSGSMMPTLNVGDFILVNKFAYGLRLPVSHYKILDLGEPERGDIVVFRPEWAPGQSWIKRVVGLPGDKVVVNGEKVSVNGKPVSVDPVGPYRGDTDDTEKRNVMLHDGKLFTEHLGDVDHQIIRMPEVHALKGVPNVPNSKNPVTVPEGCYFVMGDNRDNSRDSRYEGCISEKDLTGKAFFIWFSLDSLSRIGTILH